MKIRIYKELMSSLIYSISQLDETVGPSALKVLVQG